MKTKTAILIVVCALLAVWIGAAVLAQRGPGGPGGLGGPGEPGMRPPMAPGPIMKTGAQGVFVLLGGTLTKYDAALKEQGSRKLLEPPAGNPPADGEWRPPMPPIGILLIAPAGGQASEKAIVILGDQLFSIDTASLKVAGKAKLPGIELPKPPNDANPDRRGPAPMGPPPGPGALELQGRILYIMRGPQIVGVNVDDGSLAGKGSLPKPTPPRDN